MQSEKSFQTTKQFIMTIENSLILFDVALRLKNVESKQNAQVLRIIIFSLNFYTIF